MVTLWATYHPIGVGRSANRSDDSTEPDEAGPG